jgi:hypothetical protein
MALDGEIVQDGHGKGAVTQWSLPREPEPVPLMHCNGCGQDKPLDEFYTNRATGGRHAGCKNCRRHYGRERFRAKRPRGPHRVAEAVAA